MSQPPTNDRLVFFGTDAFSVPSLIRLLAEGWHIAGVVTKPDSPSGRGLEHSMPAVKRLALAQKVPVLQPVKLSEAIDDLKNLHANAGIVVAYGRIIPPAVLELFPKGLINVHAALLPKHRGAAPIEASLLAGDEATGVTLMHLEAGLDTGPTYASSKLQLSGTETRLDLYEQLAELGAELLANTLRDIMEENIVPIPQDHAKATHFGRLSKAQGQIDWSKPAEQLEREVRAYLGWPGSQAHIAGTDVIVTAARAIDAGGQPGTPYRTPSGELAVYASEGSLVIDRLKPAGKREMTGPEFLAGHPLSS
jgi:methionyl-tRNA formyltransferase